MNIYFHIMATLYDYVLKYLIIYVVLMSVTRIKSDKVSNINII